MVPLFKDDETYTYLDATGSSEGKTYASQLIPSNVKIMGIKPNTNYVKLIDKSGNDLSSKIDFNKDDLNPNGDNTYPMVVNEYTAKKYNLHVGDVMSFTINNKADRIQVEIDQAIRKDDPQTNQEVADENKAEKFKIVGICETFEGEEYYIDQDVANYILGLKSNLSEDFDVNNVYPNTNIVDDAISNVNSGSYNEFIDGGSLYLDTTSSLNNNYLTNLSDETNNVYQKTYQDSSLEQTNYSSKDLVSEGFNGVFTNDSNGGALLADSLTFYSPSGL